MKFSPLYELESVVAAGFKHAHQSYASIDGTHLKRQACFSFYNLAKFSLLENSVAMVVQNLNSGLLCSFYATGCNLKFQKPTLLQECQENAYKI
jgi:hypothetical protein